MSRAPTTNLLPVLPPNSRDYDRDLASRLSNVLGDLITKVNQLCEGTASVHYNETTAAPTAGLYRRGDIVRNSNPSEISGSAVVKYTLVGWMCVSDGSASATSFVQLRVPTAG